MAGRRVGPHVTRLWSGLLASVALLVAVTGVVLLAFLLPPIRFEDGAQNVLALAVFVLTAALVAVLGARSRRAVLQSRRLSEEQSALRRVA
ncbi:MAG: hypothetical protein JWR85_1024, partial [Marmoricola sp.]|nr:hypothetical protein [Marmoricola sp.]